MPPDGHPGDRLDDNLRTDDNVEADGGIQPDDEEGEPIDGPTVLAYVDLARTACE
jgi:hypothetical protein